MPGYISKRYLVSAAVVALAVPMGQAFAQTAGSADDQTSSAGAAQKRQPGSTPAGEPAANSDIIVTAQKRIQALRDVPIAITVVNDAQLNRQQITSVNDLKRIVPSLEFGEASASPGGGAFIRGIGTTISAGSGEPSTSLVVDGVPQGKLPLLNLFDIARVEVLRGPQGTLFGQSVSAGVINITTNAPKLNTVEGFFRFQLTGDGVAGSGYGRSINQGAVNLPLGDKVALRVSGHYDNVRGISDNVYLPKDSQDDYGVRAKLYAEPTDRIRVNLIGEYNRISGDYTPFLSYRDTTNPELAQVLIDCGTPAGKANVGNCSAVPDTNRENLYGLSGQIDIDLGGPTLTSITAYRKQDDVEARGFDHLPPSSATSPFPNIQNQGDRSQQLFSQEVRLASANGQALEWVLGAIYSKYTQRYDYSSVFNLYFPPPPPPDPNAPPRPAPPAQPPSAYIQTPKNEQVAVFGQGTLRLSDRLRAILGARITRDDVTATNLVGASRYSNEDKVTNFSWRIGGQYDVAERNVLYATISRGFKGPTFDDTKSPASAPRLIKQEIPTAYEIGLKGRAGRLNYDFNAFWVDVDNFQVQICTADPVTGQVCAPQNISKVTSKGAELAVYGQVVPGLDLSGGVAYTHVVYPSGFVGTDGADLGGYQIVNSPRWKFNGSAEYSFAVSNGYGGFVSGDATWRSATRYDVAVTDRVVFPAHWLVGGRVGIRTAGDRFELALYARNIFNVHEPVLIFNSVLGSQAATATTPAYTATVQIPGESFWRQVGVSGSLRF